MNVCCTGRIPQKSVTSCQANKAVVEVQGEWKQVVTSARTWASIVRLKRCGGEVRLVLPANSAGEIPVHPVQSLIKAVARAHGWYGRIVRGELTGGRSIAHATGLDERYVGRIFQCAFLAPDIVESILDGRQPAEMTLESLRTHLPIEWAAQRQLLGFSAR